VQSDRKNTLFSPNALFVVLSFLASGSFLIYRLPIESVAITCFLLTVSVFLLLFAAGRFSLSEPSRVALVVFGLVTIPALVSWVLNPYRFQQFAYDIYGEMPLVVWLSFPLVFFIAACICVDRRVVLALKYVCGFGILLTIVTLAQHIIDQWITVFGSRVYSIPALIVLVPLMLYFASEERSGAKRIFWWAGAFLVALGITFTSGGPYGLMTLLIMLGLTGALAPELLGCPPDWQQALRTIALICLVVLLALLIAISIYSFGGSILARTPFGASDSVSERLLLWESAQNMTMARPFFGYGPAGYRINAIRFYDPSIFGTIAALGTDPLVYSSSSPHSLLWETLTRLGFFGLVSFLVALALWLKHVRKGGELQLAFVIAAGSYLGAFMVNPMHWASALLGVVCAGFAIGSLARTDQNDCWDLPPLLRIAAALVAVCFIASALSTFIGVSMSRSRVASANEHYVVLREAQRYTPGHPLIERMIFETQLMTVDTPTQQELLIRQVFEAPGYINQYGPNLVRFAQIAMDNMEEWGITESEGVAQLLDTADSIMPKTPPLLGEQLRWAHMQQDLDAIETYRTLFGEVADLYPVGEDYLSR